MIFMGLLGLQFFYTFFSALKSRKEKENVEKEREGKKRKRRLPVPIGNESHILSLDCAVIVLSFSDFYCV